MRTYSGKYVDDNAIAANGFVASVKEESFLVDEGLLASALNEKKYYPDEVAATAVNLDDAQDEFAPAADAPKYVPSPTFAQKMLRADEIM